MAEKVEPHPDRNGEEAVEKARRLWDEGIASGPGEPRNWDELKAEARRLWDDGIASGQGIPAEDIFREMRERYGSASENS